MGSSLIDMSKYDLKQSVQDQLIIFGFSFIFWVSLFFAVNEIVELKGISKKGMNDIKNRIMSSFHGLSVLLLIGYHFTYQNPLLDQQNTNFQQFVLIFSSAYFLYDSLACLYYGIDGLGIGIHHVLVTVAYISSLHSLYGGTENMYALFFAEMSNIPMNARQSLRSAGLKYTSIHEFCEYAFIIIYIIARGVFVPFAVVHCVKSSYCPIVLKIICVGLFAQSIFYMFEMIKGMKRRGKQQKERKQKNIQYFWFTENPQVQQLSYYRK